MKRQPEGIPTGGQFAADRKAESASPLSNPSPNAPAGFGTFPGSWGPVSEDGQQIYTSPAGTELMITNGDDPEVEFDASIPEDSFQLYPRAGNPQQLKEFIDEALTDVAGRKALAGILSYSGDRYERIGLEAQLRSGAGGRLLKSLAFTVRDLQSNVFLEIFHDYETGVTTVSDVREGELEAAEGTSHVTGVLKDLAIGQPTENKTPQHFFDQLLKDFNQEEEKFGVL